MNSYVLTRYEPELMRKERPHIMIFMAGFVYAEVYAFKSKIFDFLCSEGSAL